MTLAKDTKGLFGKRHWSVWRSFVPYFVSDTIKSVGFWALCPECGARMWQTQCRGLCEAFCETATLIVRIGHCEMWIISSKQYEEMAALLLIFKICSNYKDRQPGGRSAESAHFGFYAVWWWLTASSFPAGAGCLVMSPVLQWDTLIFTACLLAAAKCECEHCRCSLPVPSWAL